MKQSHFLTSFNVNFGLQSYNILHLFFTISIFLSLACKGKENILTSTDKIKASQGEATDLKKNSDGRQSRNVSIGK